MDEQRSRKNQRTADINSLQERIAQLEASRSVASDAPRRSLQAGLAQPFSIRDDRVTPDVAQLKILQHRMLALEAQSISWPEEWRARDEGDGGGEPVLPAPALERFVETNLSRGEWMSTLVMCLDRAGSMGWIARGATMS